MGTNIEVRTNLVVFDLYFPISFTTRVSNIKLVHIGATPIGFVLNNSYFSEISPAWYLNYAKIAVRVIDNPENVQGENWEYNCFMMGF